ncbi:site-specific integrase [Mycolicibacterium pulveris]|nr:site-specific integrase [Mycolicibacterium pulveris]
MARKRRGFGRIRQERSGRWSAAYSGPDGRLHRASRTFVSEHDAEGWLAGERRKIDLGTWGAVERSDGVTLKAYAQKWLAERRVKGQPLRPRTRGLYESLLERLVYPDLGHVRLASLTPAQIRTWHSNLSDRPTRNAHCYALLHAICQTAVADEILDANPCRIRSAMSTERKRDIEVLTPAELDKLASKMPAPLRASVLLAAFCGLRYGETFELRRRNVAADCSVLMIRRGVTYRSGEFHVGPPKTKSGIRDVSVPPHLRPMLKAHLRNHVGRAGDSLLFPDADGGHLRADRYRPHWEKARAAIGKPHLRVHDLRHCGAVWAAQSGATTAELMHRLGHATPQMSARYLHVAEGRDAEIAERLSKLAEGT